MRIDPNPHVGQVAQTPVKPTARAEAHAAADRTEFDQASALNKALAQAPAVRAEEVARAKELVNNPGYPPPYAITRIAHLLGIHLQSDGD